ncbi:MAG: hypothetical protein COB02_05380 [Candidatus Cloacimonadota bacterium]|nr:MAG: hypothetical protein COB02_05380 [Candidatus Cloacimonadota bacterium]
MKILLFTLIIMNFKSIANETKTINLTQLWSQLITWHPLVLIKQYKLESSDGEIEQSSKKINPEFSFEIEEFGGSKSRKGFDDALVQVSLSQLFERGKKRQKRITISEIEKSIEILETNKSIQELFFEMKEKYLETLFSKSRLQLELALYKMTLEFEEVMKKLVKYGKISPIGLERVKILKSSSQIDLNEAQSQFKINKMELFSLSGFDEKIESFKLLDLKENSFSDENFDWNKSVQMKIFNKKLELQKAKLNLERSKAKQDYSFGGAIQNFTGNDEKAFVLSYTVALGVYDRNQGGIRAQKARVNIQKEQIRLDLLNLRVKLKKLKNQMSFSKSKLNTLKNIIVPSSEKLYQRVIKAQNAGKSDYLAVLEARRNLIENKRLELNIKHQLLIEKNKIDQILLNKVLEIK